MQLPMYGEYMRHSPQCRCVRVLQFQRDQIAAGHETLGQRARPRAVVVERAVVAGARHAPLTVARHQRGEVLAVARHDRLVVGVAFAVGNGVLNGCLGLVKFLITILLINRSKWN